MVEEGAQWMNKEMKAEHARRIQVYKEQRRAAAEAGLRSGVVLEALTVDFGLPQQSAGDGSIGGGGGGGGGGVSFVAASELKHVACVSNEFLGLRITVRSLSTNSLHCTTSRMSPVYPGVYLLSLKIADN